MCTNHVLIKRDGTAKLADRLGVDTNSLIFSDNFTPGSRISIVTGPAENRRVTPAIWWLYLQQAESGLKPHPDYFSVNTNHAQLPRKAEYMRSRCIVMVSAYAESQGGKNPHLLESADECAMAFGGLYKTWTDKTTGEIVHSASIITLAGHPALAHIHAKSIPLWLPEDIVDRWLDPTVTDTSEFSELLKPTMRKPLRATPIDKMFTKRPIGPAIILRPRPKDGWPNGDGKLGKARNFSDL